METIKIKLHSSVDLITNSSTVIFTYSEGSLQAVKELVNEMLKTFSRTETFDDLFYAGVFAEENYVYSEFEEFPEGTDLKQLIDDILTGKTVKPEWMKKAEEDTSCCDYYSPSSTLCLRAKNEIHSELANKLLSYLYSTDHEATRDG